LQLRQILRRDTHIGQLAEAGIDSINRLACRQDLLDQLPACRDAPERCRGHADGPAAQRDLLNLRKGQCLSIQNQSFHDQNARRRDGPSPDTTVYHLSKMPCNQL
jgi:hypothetical protein